MGGHPKKLPRFCQDPKSPGVATFQILIPIADNQTRWNSVYLSIVRGIKLCCKFQQFSEAYEKEPGANFLLQEDWDVLRWLAQALEPFYHQTQRLQGNARLGHHGAIWEALPTMEYILAHLEKLTARGRERCFVD